MSVTVRFDKKTLDRAMKMFDPKQVRYAAAVAMTRTGAIAKGEIRDEIRAVFKSPSKFTLNSTFSTRAKPSNLQLMVGINDQARYMIPHVLGGPRDRKRSEVRMNSIIKPKRFLTGTMKRGEVTQILSAMKVLEMGNKNTDSKRGKSKAKKQAQYAAIKLPGHKGIHVYKRKGKGNRGLKLVWWSAKQPHYKKRLDIRSVVNAVVDVHMGKQFEIALDEALSTAK